jgi:N-acetylglucosamine kinase-like BadF-type ATPase
LDLADPIALIPWTAAHDDASFKRHVAALTPLVFGLAQQNDPAACRIIRQAQSHLVDQVLTAVRRLDRLKAEADATAAASPWAIVCAGGLFEQNEDFYQALASRIERHDGRLQGVRLREPASLGALALGEESSDR